MSDQEQSTFTAAIADGRQIIVNARDEETAMRLAREQAGGVGVLSVKSGAKKEKPSKTDDSDNQSGRATKPATGEPGETTPAGTPTGEPGTVEQPGPFGASSGGNAGVGGGNLDDGDDADEDEDDGGLTGEALDKAAAELEIEGRSSMTADEKRAAVRKARREDKGQS